MIFFLALIFNFNFLTTSEDIGWEVHLRCNLRGVKWDINLN